MRRLTHRQKTFMKQRGIYEEYLRNRPSSGGAFLEQKHLSSAYVRYKRLPKRTYRQNVQVADEKKELLIYRRGKDVVAADAYTLEPLARSRREKTTTIGRAISSRRIGVSKLRVREMKTTRAVTTDRLRHKGIPAKIELTITFTKHANSGRIERMMTVTGLGSYTSDPHNSREYRRMYDSAFSHCLAQVDFSPDEHEVIYEHFVYYEERRR